MLIAKSRLSDLGSALGPYCIITKWSVFSDPVDVCGAHECTTELFLNNVTGNKVCPYLVFVNVCL